MTDWSKVTVRIDEHGHIAGLDVEGDIDRDNLTEERPETPPLPEDPDVGRAFWPLG